MKNTRIFLAGCLCFIAGASTFAQENLVAATSTGSSTDNFEFTVEKKIPITPIKDQASSSTCWSYAGAGFVEAEMLRMGKPAVDLAEMFVVYKVYQEKADRFVRMHGNFTFAPGGEAPDVLDVIKKYGALPQEAYTGLIPGEVRNAHKEMDSTLRIFMDGVVVKKVIRADWKKAFDGILDSYLGQIPEEFTYQGKKYTPRTFADKVVGINPADYAYLTSWSSNPYYEKMDLLVPDNWAWEKYHNIPLDELISTIDNALANGYTVAWAADVSEKGFSSKVGIAIVPQDEDSEDIFSEPKPEQAITEQMRQRAFDDYRTQDDHGMLIFGTAKDQNGKKYYIVKNSWGMDRGRDGGLVYVSEAFMRLKTISILVNKAAVPSGISKKLK